MYTRLFGMGEYFAKNDYFIYTNAVHRLGLHCDPPQLRYVICERPLGGWSHPEGIMAGFSKNWEERTTPCCTFTKTHPYQPIRIHQKKVTYGLWLFLTLANCNKVGSAFFWNTTPIWTQNGPWKKNPSMAFWKIAILRFLLNEMRHKLTNFRGEFTEGSTFETDLM